MSAAPETPNGQTLRVVRAGLRTPRAAAIAGIAFSLLLIASLWLLRLSIPTDPYESGDWLATGLGRVRLALNFIPVAGIAFMWFLGGLRDRLGDKEDKFFATVFLGSGLLFLGMLFSAAASVGSLVLVASPHGSSAMNIALFGFGRAFTYNIMHIYAFKMAAVFMMSTSTLAIQTRITARWIALFGYASALALFIGSSLSNDVFFFFPSWVFLVSTDILVKNLRGRTPQWTTSV
jgi:hypothetical protein